MRSLLTKLTINDDVGALALAVALGEAEALAWNERQHSGDNICIQPRFFYPNASPFPRVARAKHLEAEIGDYPIDSRPNADARSSLPLR